MLNSITIQFSKKLYTKRAIKESVKVYQKLADFDVQETKNYMRVVLKNIDKDVKDVIGDEFCNYVLSKLK